MAGITIWKNGDDLEKSGGGNVVKLVSLRCTVLGLVMAATALASGNSMADQFPQCGARASKLLNTGVVDVGPSIVGVDDPGHPIRKGLEPTFGPKCG